MKLASPVCGKVKTGLGPIAGRGGLIGKAQASGVEFWEFGFWPSQTNDLPN